jgi:hypothetical protein
MYSPIWSSCVSFIYESITHGVGGRVSCIQGRNVRSYKILPKKCSLPLRRNKSTTYSWRTGYIFHTVERKIDSACIQLLHYSYCDGLAQSINLWSHNNPLLGKYFPNTVNSGTSVAWYRTFRWARIRHNGFVDS